MFISFIFILTDNYNKHNFTSFNNIKANSFSEVQPIDDFNLNYQDCLLAINTSKLIKVKPTLKEIGHYNKDVTEIKQLVHLQDGRIAILEKKEIRVFDVKNNLKCDILYQIKEEDNKDFKCSCQLDNGHFVIGLGNTFCYDTLLGQLRIVEIKKNELKEIASCNVPYEKTKDIVKLISIPKNRIAFVYCNKITMIYENEPIEKEKEIIKYSNSLIMAEYSKKNDLFVISVDYNFQYTINFFCMKTNQNIYSIIVKGFYKQLNLINNEEKLLLFNSSQYKKVGLIINIKKAIIEKTSELGNNLFLTLINDNAILCSSGFNEVKYTIKNFDTNSEYCVYDIQVDRIINAIRFEDKILFCSQKGYTLCSIST